jgi:uncharacterized membrane protein YdjX (TVP38/TMEM64 family)
MKNFPADPDKPSTTEVAAAPAMPLGRPTWLLWTLVALLFLAMAGLLLWGCACHYGWIDTWCEWYRLLEDKDRIREWLKGAGGWAPLVFILSQILQVLFAPFPGEATGFIGGFLFGVPLGALYSTIGLTIGSMLAFLLGHLLEVKFVERVVSRETMEKFDFLMERQGILIAFFLFLLPGFPKDYLCFILGLSHMSWKLFALMVTVGRLPGTLMLTLQGAQVYKGNYYVTIILVAACLVLAGIMYYYREPLYQWLRRWDGQSRKGR